MERNGLKLRALLWIMACTLCGAAHAQRLSLSLPNSVQAGSTVSANVVLDAPAGLSGVQFTLDLRGGEHSVYNTSLVNAPLLSFGNLAEAPVSPFFPEAIVSTQPNLVSDDPISYAYQTVTVAVAGTALRKGKNTVVTIPVRVAPTTSNGVMYQIRLSQVSGSNLKGENVFLPSEAYAYFNVVNPTSPPKPPSSTTPTKPTIPTPPPGPDLLLTGSSGVAGGTATMEIDTDARLSTTNGVQFTLHYDPSLTVDPGIEGEIKLGSAINGVLAAHVTQPGILNIALAGSNPGHSPASLMMIRFHLPASAAVGTEYPVSLSDSVGGFNGGYGYTLSHNDVSLTVGTEPELPKIQEGLVTFSLGKGHRRDVVQMTLKGNGQIGNVTGLSMRIAYRTRYPESVGPLEFVDAVTPGPTLVGSSILTDTATPGEVAVTLTGGAGTGGNPLVTLPFKIPANATQYAAYALEVSDVRLTIGGFTYRSNASDGWITVLGRKRGDVANVEGEDDGDGQVDVLDAISLLKIVVADPTVASTDSQYTAADANCDHRVTVADVITTLRMAVNLPVTTCSE